MNNKLKMLFFELFRRINELSVRVKTKKTRIFSRISKRIVSSPSKYFLRKIFHSFSESSLFNIWFLKLIRYDIYHCLYDMGTPTYLGEKLSFKRPHTNNDGDLIVGTSVLISDGCMIDYSGGVKIDDYASLSDRVVIYTHNHPMRDHRWLGLTPYHLKFTHLHIGSRAWIGCGSIILPETTYIGKHATVAAGSVVTRNVPDYAIVSGNPAKIVAYKNKD